MGQDESRLVDEKTPAVTLESRSIEAVAKYITSGRAKSIVVMTGAGISTSAGIPDFRSPTTGLYANLARLNLPYAEAVFDIGYFRTNPLPFYTLAQELYPGAYRPTITHSFIHLLHTKGLLLKLFTQNIDCLEREAGVPDDKIIEAHGSFARQSCIECKAAYPEEGMKKAIREKQVPRCMEKRCGGLVKPEIVFFGEQLPKEFFENRFLPEDADLAIVMGTSLSVQPFASLPGFCRKETPRVLINQEQVGDLGSRTDDVLLLEDCDAGVRKLAEACGWLEELEELWARTKKQGQVKGPQATRAEDAGEAAQKKSRDEQLQDEVDKLTREVEENLRLTQEQHQWLENHKDNNFARKRDDDGDEEKEETERGPTPEPTEESLTAYKGIAASVAATATKRYNSEPQSEGSGSLVHVYPWLGKKSSL